jgi:hypothetical protein
MATIVIRVADSDAPVMQAMLALWQRIRRSRPRIPGAVIELQPGRQSSCTSVDFDGPAVIQVNLMNRGSKLTGRQIAEFLLHQAAHSLAGPQTSQEGRYHGAGYRDAAEGIGLDAGDYTTSGGWSHTTLATDRYDSEISALDEALAVWQPTEQVKASRSSRNLLPAQCSCDPPRKLRVSESTLSKGEIRCSICGAPFAITSS